MVFMQSRARAPPDILLAGDHALEGVRAEQAADRGVIADVWGVGFVHDELEAVEQPRVLVEEGAEEALAVGDQRGERLARAVGLALLAAVVGGEVCRARRARRAPEC